MEREHRELAVLIERAGHICRQSVDPRAKCATCGEAALDQCRYALDSFATEVRTQLIGHIHREDAVMELLPKEVADLASCRHHREEHSRFVQAYNTLAVEARLADVRHEAGLFERFLLGWVRDHVMVFGADPGWPRHGA